MADLFIHIELIKINFSTKKNIENKEFYVKQN